MAEVIKGSSLATARGVDTAPRAAAFNFTDMAHKADLYLQQVREQAQKILTDARATAQAEAEQIKARAQQEGRQAALQAAEASLRKHVETQLQRVLPALETAASQVLQANEAWQQHWDSQLVKLALAMAECIVRREIQADAHITLQWVKEALELGRGQPSIEVHLHPDDVAALQERVQEIAQRLSKLGPVRLVSDAAVSRGGCRVKSDFGVIDQTVEAQLARIQQELQ